MMSIPVNVNSNPRDLDNLFTLNLLTRFKCFSIGTIKEIKQAPNKVTQQQCNYFVVELPYKIINKNGTQKTSSLIYCSVATLKHCKMKYEIGDKVAIAYTDQHSGDFLDNNRINLYEYTDTTTMHAGGNGVILFSIDKFNKDDNKSVSLKNDKANITITTESSGETLKIENNKATITIDNKGAIDIKNDKANVKIDNTGKISIKNSAKSIADLIATDITTYVKSLIIQDSLGAPCVINDSAAAPVLQQAVKSLFN